MKILVLTMIILILATGCILFCPSIIFIIGTLITWKTAFWILYTPIVILFIISVYVIISRAFKKEGVT